MSGISTSILHIKHCIMNNVIYIILKTLAPATHSLNVPQIGSHTNTARPFLAVGFDGLWLQGEAV